MTWMPWPLVKWAVLKGVGQGDMVQNMAAQHGPIRWGCGWVTACSFTSVPTFYGAFWFHSPTGVRIPGHLCLLLVWTQWSHFPFFSLSIVVHRDICLVVNMAKFFSISQITAMLLEQSKSSYFELATPSWRKFMPIISKFLWLIESWKLSKLSSFKELC